MNESHLHDVMTCTNHSKINWKKIINNNENYYLHVPSTTLLLEDNLEDECYLCYAEKQIPIPKREKPRLDIKSIALNIVEKCNLRCTYCFAGDGDYGFESKMTFEIAKKVINEFTCNNKRLHLVFFGGEPLLNFKLIQDIVIWCEEKDELKLTYGMTTNGILLDENKMVFFREYKFKLNVSYDGPKLQDLQRLSKNEKVSSNQIINKKMKLFSEGLEGLRSLQFRSTISKDHLPAVYLNILEMLNSSKYKIAYSRVSNHNKKMAFSSDDITKLGKILEKIVDHLISKEDFQALLRIASISTYVKAINLGEYRRNFCGAGLNYLSVSTRGKYYLCHRFTEDEEECIGEVGLGFHQKKLQEIYDIRSQKNEPCKSCWMRNICAGGCFYEHKVANSTISKIDPTFCQLQEIELLQSMKVYITLTKKAPDLLE